MAYPDSDRVGWKPSRDLRVITFFQHSPVKTITNHLFVFPGYKQIIKHTLNKLVPISWPLVPEICSQRFRLETKIHLQRPIITIVPTTAAATPRLIRSTLDFLDFENLNKVISGFAKFYSVKIKFLQNYCTDSEIVQITLSTKML